MNHEEIKCMEIFLKIRNIIINNLDEIVESDDMFMNYVADSNHLDKNNRTALELILVEVNKIYYC